MSRGPGRIDRSIRDAMELAPSNFFSVLDLAKIAYPEAVIERRHMQSVRRALAKVVDANGLPRKHIGLPKRGCYIEGKRPVYSALSIEVGSY